MAIIIIVTTVNAICVVAVIVIEYGETRYGGTEKI